MNTASPHEPSFRTPHGLVPHGRHAKIEMASVSWNYTTVLNIVFLLVAAMLLWRYFRRGGGWQMLRMMNKPINATDEHHHQHSDHRPGGGHRHGEGATPACASQIVSS